MPGRHEDRDNSGRADWAEAEQDHRAGAAVPPADEEQQQELAQRRSFRAATSAGSVLYGPDVHPVFQKGLSIDQVAAEGFSFLAVKASQGTSSSWAAGADTWLDRADQLGMVTWCYHYVDTSSVAAQAQTVKTGCRGRPVMMDFEANSGSVANLKALIAACQNLGVRVPLAYVPRWYWQQLGSPSLAGLPPIVSSRYLTATGYASAIYSQVPASFWDSYGGGVVQLLQFSDRASVAGQKIDVNAFRGTKDQLRALVYGTGSTPAPSPEVDVGTPADNANELLNRLLPDPVVAGHQMNVADQLTWACAHAAYARQSAAQAVQQLAGLQAAVDKLADAVGTGQGIDPDELKQAVAAAIEESVTVSGEITITPK